MKHLSLRLKPALALVATGVLCAIAACRTHYPLSNGAFGPVNKAPDVAHGKALTFSACGGCHYDIDRGAFSGKRMQDLPAALGKVYASNITQSRSHGTMWAYSEADFAYLMRTGITRDGRFIPYMLRPNISDEGLRDILAFLRSDDRTVLAKDKRPGITRLTALGRVAIRFAGKPQRYRASIPSPRTELETGRYLTDITGCFHCHSRKLTALDYAQPERSKGYMAGGAAFKQPGGGKVRGGNLTMDRQTGIGRYSKQDFRDAVQHMTAPGGRALKPPMEAYDLSDAEVDAIFAYLQSLPAKRHKVSGQRIVQ